MKNYIIDDYDKLFQDYPQYAKLFVFTQYTKKHFNKSLSLNTYSKIFKQVNKVLTNFNMLAHNKVLIIDKQGLIKINNKYLNSTVFKPFKMRDAKNQLIERYFDNDESIKEFITQYQELIDKEPDNQLSSQLLTLINDNPGLHRKELTSILQANDVEFNPTLFSDSLKELVDNKKVKAQTGERITSSFAKFYAFDFKFDNTPEFMSLSNIIYQLIADNEGINRISIVNIINVQYHVSATLVTNHLHELLDNKLIVNENNKRSAYYTKSYFDKNISNKKPADTKQVSLNDIKTKLLNFIKFNPGINKLILLNLFADNYHFDKSKASQALLSLLDEQSIKTQIGADIESDFVNLFVNNYKFTDEPQYKSLDLNIIDCVKNSDGKGININDISSFVSQYYNVDEDKLQNELKQLVKTNFLTKIKSLYFLPNIISDNKNKKTDNKHQSKKSNKIRQPKIDNTNKKKLNAKQAILHYLAKHPNSSKQEVINQLQRFSDRTIYINLKRLVNNNQISFEGRYNDKNTKLKLVQSK